MLGPAFLPFLGVFSPQRGEGTQQRKISEKERKEELKKLYDLCSFDEELDKELGTMAGIDGGYLTTALEKIIK